jgi:glycosyltransferase involved in cell wall biosynthesis
MLRDAVPILLGRLGLGRRRVVLSLHGSVFMRWADGSLEIRMFRLLLGNCGIVTALGEGHRERLVSLGYPRERIAVLVNSCEIQPLSQQAFAAKLTAEAGSRGPVRCLHLSSLIDTKGFPEYLEALGALSKADGPRIEAVLCGRLAASEFSGRFGDLAAARRWILERISEINRGSRVRVRWIEGAVGEEKAALFRNADIFVLPTRYAVEAQPLVLLEAMASGCAIITSAAGEIRAILDDSTALFLPNVSARSVESALATLAGDAVLRARLALAAHGRFAADFCLERHLDAWERLLGPNLPVGKASH